MAPLSALNKYFWKYRSYLLLGLIFILLTNYFRILSPQLTGYVVNTVVKGLAGNAEVPDEDGFNFLVKIIVRSFHNLPFKEKILACGLILIITAIISGFFMFLMRQTLIVMSRKIEFDQKNEIYQHFQKLDTDFYKMHSTGDMMNRISEDVSRVRQYTGPAIMYFINLSAVIGFSIFFMFRSDPELSIMALSPLPLLALTIYLVNTVINRKSERIQQKLSELTTTAQESYSGIRVIKSFVQEKAMYEFFRKNAEAYRENALSLAKTEAIYFPSMGLMIGISTLITILAGSLNVIHHQPGASVGKIAEFVMYIQMLTFPVSAIGWTASMIQRGSASQKRINEFLQTTPAILENRNAIAHVPQGRISFKNVSFTYPHTGIKAIQNFSLEISKGQKIAILGKTGSGKSTLTQLLLRMYEPQQGSILLDGMELNDITLSSLRKGISCVPQDVFLFSDSIRNNIRFGNAEAEEEEIRKAALHAGILKEIESFPKAFDTILGERGVTLSGGQKQRVSIARALLKKSEILVLDDCLSAVDSQTEKLICNHLQADLKDKTAIIITHRVIPSIQFDKILVLEDGSISEEGTHEELMRKKGHYFRVFSDIKQDERAE